MMEINEIYAIIIAAAPAITAVIGIVVALGVGIGNIKRANNTVINESKDAHQKTMAEIKISNEELKAFNVELVKTNQELKRENAELKEQLTKVMDKLNHVHVKDK